MIGRRSPRVIESKKRTNETTQPNATSPSKAFHAQSPPRSCGYAVSILAKNVRVRLDCIERARVVIPWELGRPVRVVKSPSGFRFGFIAQAGTGWLPRLVECLEVEDVLIPAKQSAHALLEEGVCFIDTVFSGSVAGSG